MTRLFPCSTLHPAVHLQMVFEAIKNLRERNGSSMPAIKKYMVASHPEVANKFAQHQFRAALKKGIVIGKFVKVSRISQHVRL